MSIAQAVLRLRENFSYRALQELTDLCANKKVCLRYTDHIGMTRTLYLTDDNIGKLISILIHGGLEHVGGHSEPGEPKRATDYMHDIFFEHVSNVEVIELSGAFFPYSYLGPGDLSRYQVYRKDQQHNGVHCLMHSLSESGLNISSLDIGCGLHDLFPLANMGDVATRLGVNIAVSVCKSNGYVSETRTFKGGEKTVKLVLLHKHYMVYSKYILSELRHAIKKEQLEPFLVSPAMCQPTPLHRKEKKSSKATSISVADIFCTSKPRIVPIVYSRYCDGKYYVSGGKADTDWRLFCQFLRGFEEDKRHVVYFRDLKYAWSIIHRCPYISIRSVLKKDSIYYSATITSNKKLIELRDLSNMIPCDARDYARTFGTQTIVNYTCKDLYTLDTCSSTTSTVNYVAGKSQHEMAYVVFDSKLSKRISSTDCIVIGDTKVDSRVIDLCPMYFVDGTYFHIPHLLSHAKDMCTALYAGAMVFRERMLDLMGIDCFTKLTLPSLVHQRMCEKGSYEGVRPVTGSLRKFISESVHGGRVQTRLNKMWDVRSVLKVIDGKSLYPSAIRELCSNGGFPTGECSTIVDWDQRQQWTHYIARIRITKVAKHQQLPFVSYWDGETRQYTNNPPPEPVVVDKITLEDWIDFHGIEYDFLEGVYWTDGTVAIAGNYIQELYDARMRYASDGNIGMSYICKICLNSLYGKTILKPSAVKTVIKHNSKAGEYALKNFDKLVESEQCSNQTIFYVRADTDDHVNMAHVGGLILSWSRRIMNRVLNVANMSRIPVMYMDTDSMHIVDTDGGLAKLIDTYRDVYSKELIGRNLGQFAEELAIDGCTDVYSTRQLILGKKVYLHTLVGTGNDGKEETKVHYRIKSINKYAMEEYPDVIDLYERMYQGEEIPFDLAYGDGCIMNYSGSVSIRSSYVRKLSFQGEKGSMEELKEW